jgi:hypothetical protein
MFHLANGFGKALLQIVGYDNVLIHGRLAFSGLL